MLLKMSILLELRFERNLNIYEVSSFEDFENVMLGKLVEYSLLVKND